MKFKPKFAAKHVGHLVQQNSPTILSAIAVVGVAATGYLAAKAAFTAGRSVQGFENIKTPEDANFKLDTVETVKVVWKDFVPAAAVGTLTVACIIASNRIQARRLAALAAAYAVLSGDFDEYRNKALEIAGVKKTKEIDDKVATEKMKKTPPPENVSVPEGKAWFCDLSTMHYFLSDRQEVEHAINQLNYHLLHSGDFYASLNDYYAFMGLPLTGVGNQLGWTNEQQVEFVPTPTLREDGSSATGIKLTPEPAPDFDSLH